MIRLGSIPFDLNPVAIRLSVIRFDSTRFVSLLINSDGLSREQWNDAHNQGHQQYGICAEVHANLAPLWWIALVLGELIHAHP